ncbi:MarR family winged helix-turn-helix transcriptional regulator [Sphaerisporangium krabiense]|uniref:DNA-binding MarR family transcriptional regulator n=1 Tax=Sphaerisporangium krabiense TaxID=763782 RepID=A0A7W8Z8I7_9ACTN|nr:MarR family transcriptional regulator [Sphaerisporangium krabiense]MBB5629416.1 DNA-binding MarR family transcriptional regulator [Sphaerisporangium krabiense]
MSQDWPWLVEEASLVLVEVTLDAVAEMGDLSLTQLRALLAVDRHGPLNLSSLATRLNMSLSAAGRMVDRLDGLGLLQRFPAPHSRREIRIDTTSDGREVLERLRSARRRRIGTVLERLTPDARTQLTHVLQEFTAADASRDHDDLTL